MGVKNEAELVGLLDATLCKLEDRAARQVANVIQTGGSAQDVGRLLEAMAERLKLELDTLEAAKDLVVAGEVKHG